MYAPTYLVNQDQNDTLLLKGYYYSAPVGKLPLYVQTLVSVLIYFRLFRSAETRVSATLLKHYIINLFQ
jgi:hypothetical protein